MFDHNQTHGQFVCFSSIDISDRTPVTTLINSKRTVIKFAKVFTKKSDQVYCNQFAKTLTEKRLSCGHNVKARLPVCIIPVDCHVPET